ncbi:MAG: hypothetical protein L6V93_16690 [Clostridiales bacterium]|nr:MAG: hypothetical protein L6V93_16690 [Clostridiales bacterium]
MFSKKHKRACGAFFEAGFIDNTAEEKNGFAKTLMPSQTRSTAPFAKKTDYPTATEAVAILQKMPNYIRRGKKWYNGTWNDADFKWLFKKKTASYIDKARKKGDIMSKRGACKG